MGDYNRNINVAWDDNLVVMIMMSILIHDWAMMEIEIENNVSEDDFKFIRVSLVTMHA